MVAYWSLEESSGTRNDSHGANHLTDNNTVASATGKVGTAGDFETGNSEWLSIASNSSLHTGDIDFSFAAWVNLESTGNRDIVGKWNATGDQREYVLLYSTTSNTFRFGITAAGVTQINADATSFGAASTATWYFVVAWHDATANTISICVNDGAVDSTSHTTGVFTGTSSFGIGYRSSSTAYMDGLIDEVGFWKRVLSADEITELYNSGSGRDYAYISGAGGTVYDQTVAGTLTSAGALIRSTGKVIAGTLTSAGALLKSMAKAFGGTLTSSGVLTQIRTYLVTVAGTLTSDGALLRSTGKVLAGTLTSAGDINKAIGKLIAGTLTSAGDLARSTAKSLAGTLTSSGALATARAYLVSLAGTLTSAGALSRSTSKVLAGTLTTAGSISKAIGKVLSGTLTSLGSLLAVLAGSVTPHLDVEVSDAAVTVLTLTDSAVYTVTLSDQSRS